MAMSPGEMVAQRANQEPENKPDNAVASDLNPVLDAFRTIATFVAAKSEQGDPNATEMQALLGQFVKLLQGGAGTPEDRSQMAPPAGTGNEEQASMPNKMSQVKRANPMMGKMSAGAKAQTGRIAVI